MDDFVGVGTVIIEHAVQWFELAQCVVTLCSAAGVPILAVDNAVELTDTQRRRYLSHALAMNPLYAMVVETRAPAISDDLMVMMLPILDPNGLLGVIHCSRPKAFTPLSSRDLSVLAAQVSVRLTQLGVTTANKLDALSDRQHEVARLVGRGLANHQIAAILGVSENTVKKHLKDVFARLGVANRTELASRLAHAGRRIDPPLGITRTGSVVITRGTW